MTTVTISGIVSHVEESRRDNALWVALVLSGTPQWKIILKDKAAEEVLAKVCAGSEVVASGTYIQSSINDNQTVLKLFATDCMRFDI